MLTHTRIHDETVVPSLPTFYSIHSSLYRGRAKTQPTLPKTRDEVNLTGSWTNTSTGERFLLADEGDMNKILIFATVDNLIDLSTADTWYMDGTFYSSPAYFAQVYSIHALLNGHMTPLVYALLPNKSQDTYERFLTLLQDRAFEKNVPLNPETIMMDYEMAAWRASEKVFNVSVKGCFFHYTQCVWRKVQSVSLVNEFRDNDDIKRLVRRAAALPLVPVNKVEDAWFETLEECEEDSQNVLKFKDYITERWVEHYELESWNHFDTEGPRTTNHVEGWHHKINNALTHPDPNIYTIVSVFQNEQALNEAKHMQYSNGGKQAPRKRVYRELDNNLTKLKEKLVNCEIDLMHYTDSVSYLVKLGK